MKWLAQLCFCLLPRVTVLAEEVAPLSANLQTNGAHFLQAVAPLQQATRASVVQILDERGGTAQLGMVVSNDGYVLTKASEFFADELRLAWSDGTQCAATAVLKDQALDLLLLKAERATSKPSQWQSAKEAKPGEWMLAFTKVEDASLGLRLGTLSARRRTIPGRGAALGIQMAPYEGEHAVRIVAVGSESPAETAGIKPDDLLVAVEGQPVLGIRSVEGVIGQCQPGQPVKLRIRRGRGERDYLVRLASRSKVVSNWEGEDYANGGVSLRTDSFPEALQHQLPLSPRDMGGPLLNLTGQVVGINIARVDRVTSFALPMELFWNKLQQWLEADRQAHAER